MRIYANPQRDEANALDVVVGIFSSFNSDAFVLFDPGSTHSCVSVALSCHANVELVRMRYDVIVSSPIV